MSSSLLESSSSEPARPPEPGEQWIPGHCMYKPNLTLQTPRCPVGYSWRKGHYRRMPSVESTHKFMNRFERRLKHRVARNPEQCPSFENLEEFQDCMRLVRRSLQSYLLKNPTRSQAKQYVDHLVERVFMCTGQKLQDECYFQPTTVARRYIEQQVQDLLQTV